MRTRAFGALPFYLPAVVLYLLVIVIPSLYSFYLSFFKWNGVSPVKQFVGLQNFIFLFTQDSVFYTALKNNFIWTVLSIIFSVILGLALAMLLNMKFRGRLVFRGIFYLPYVLSGVAVSIMWAWMYHPQYGFINSSLDMIGLEALKKGWLSEPKYALYAVLAANMWHQIGAPFIMFLAGLQSIPTDPYEAAKIEGANRIQTFFYVTIPLLKETFLIVISITIISGMKVFDMIIAMTEGGPAQSTQVLSTWMYMQTFNFSNMGVGSAISWILVLVTMIVTIPYTLYMSKH